MASSSLAVAVGHLNAPYGAVLDEAGLAAYLRGQHDEADGPKAAILGELFIELSPRLLAQCAVDLGLALDDLARLYERSLASGGRRSAQWEAAMRDALQ